jgi:lambda family phage portal protein
MKSRARVKKSTRSQERASAVAKRSVPALSTAVVPQRRAVNFDAGGSGRRLRSIPTTTTAINTLIRQYGGNIVRRSRYLAANNPYASSAKETYIAAMVGCGIKPSWMNIDKALKKEIQRVFKRWTDESDADGQTDYYGQQALIAGELFEAGECFVRVRERRLSDGFVVPFQLQLLPTEMLPTDHNEVLAGGSRIEMGIEFNPIGQRVAYHFLRHHPGEQSPKDFTKGMRVRVPAEQIFHIYRPMRVGQIRGLPHTLAGIVALAMYDLYEDAELERKRIAALFAAFVTRPKQEDAEDHPLRQTISTTDATNDVSDFALEPGVVVDLHEGQDIKFAEPADVGANFESFTYRALLRAAAGFSVPYADMSGDLRATSYGSQRAGMISFKRKIEPQQHSVFGFQLCRRVVRLFMDTAVLVGGIKGLTAAAYSANPAAYLDVKHITPKWDWIDPLKDQQAAKLGVDSGFHARSDVIESQGEDPEDNDLRIRDDQLRADELGIKFVTLPSGTIVAPDDSDSLVDTPTAPGNNSLDDFDFG